MTTPERSLLAGISPLVPAIPIMAKGFSNLGNYAMFLPYDKEKAHDPEKTIPFDNNC